MAEKKKVWVYLSDKEFSEDMEKSIAMDTYLFLQNWKAHGNPLSSGYEIFYHRFIVISVNEEEFSASGCSIDKQLQFIKQIESKYNLNLLNRLLAAYLSEDKVEVVPSSKIAELLSSKTINENTIVFNPAVSTGREFETSWQIPLKESWLKKYLN